MTQSLRPCDNTKTIFKEDRTMTDNVVCHCVNNNISGMLEIKQRNMKDIRYPIQYKCRYLIVIE